MLLFQFIGYFFDISLDFGSIFAETRIDWSFAVVLGGISEIQSLSLLLQKLILQRAQAARRSAAELVRPVTLHSRMHFGSRSLAIDSRVRIFFFFPFGLFRFPRTPQHRASTVGILIAFFRRRRPRTPQTTDEKFHDPSLTRHPCRNYCRFHGRIGRNGF